ncbi:Uu.00g095180.m01.CDS01 [Anthostomella pinea]|uniref:Uu.00g095180.m01.CDS01 n=1 Tax=Anthostomella pinea TaxID=933095 RepID=A0AAI8YMQ3_9PEZI|nr:Uu.00g095180.m01.CDS01 [Anthostomella pinea]
MQQANQDYAKFSANTMQMRNNQYGLSEASFMALFLVASKGRGVWQMGKSPSQD